MFVVKDQATLMVSLCQFTLSELVHDCDLPITVTWSSRVRAQFVSVSAASAHLHHLHVWNDLPSELKNSDINRQGFKSSLKTRLFSVPTRNSASVNFV